MKFRRSMSAIYSSALVLGLTLLFYPETVTAISDKPGHIEMSTPTAPPEATRIPDAQTDAPFVTIVPNVQNTPAIEPETPSVPDQKVHPLFLDKLETPSTGVADLVTSYLKSYYSCDFETLSTLVTDASLLSSTLIEKNAAKVTEVRNINLYSKTGIDDIFSVVYATYSLYYSDTMASIPQFSEFYIKRYDNGSFRIYIAPLASKTKEAMLKSKQTESILTLMVSSLIQRFNIACLTGNETLMKQCVTDTDYLNLDFYRSRYAVTEGFSDYEFLLYPGINEFDYIVFVSYKEKVVFSDTAAPCMDYYFISLDTATGNPSIYLGITSLDTDAYCAAITQSEEIQTLAAQTNERMQKALFADDDLKDFYQLLLGSQ